jgi:D-sedoheptulose 7-phosphate isomerase
MVIVGLMGEHQLSLPAGNIKHFAGFLNIQLLGWGTNGIGAARCEVVFYGHWIVNLHTATGHTMNLHIAGLTADFPQLKPARDNILGAFEMLAATFRGGGKLLLCGNGGSAADCGHWAGELLKSFRSPRHLGDADRQKLGPELAGRLQGGLPAVPLPSLTEFATAWANDRDPEYVFAQGVWALGKPVDTLAAITTSGNSPNVIRAAETARAIGIKVLGLTGGSGGKLAALCDRCIRVPESEVYRIQQLHLPVFHCLCLMLEDEFFPES